jgi:DNA-binding Lrp family transcriptional regulator
MDGYWDGIDKEILEVLTAGGPMDPVDLARALGMSTGAVCSCLGMLTAEGKVRIRRVEATKAPLSLARAA